MSDVDGTPNGAALVLDQLRASLDGNRYSLKAIYAAIGISFGGAIVVIVLVLLVWHKLKEIYASQPLLSKRISFFANSIPNVNKTNPFADPLKEEVKEVENEVQLRPLVKQAFDLKENEMLLKHGLDATVYLRALRMNRNIFAILTLLLFCTAAPINIVFNLHRPYVTNLTHRDSLLLITPSLLSAHQMIPHVVLGWVSNIVVLALLWYNFKKVLLLRRRVLLSPAYQSNVYNRTVMVTDVPNKIRSRAMLSLALSCLNRGREAPENVFLGQVSNSEIDGLMKQHAEMVKRYEKGCSCSKLLDADETELFLQRKSEKPEAVKLHKEIIQLENKINTLRAGYVGRLNNYAFAEFSSVKLAHTTCRPSSKREAIQSDSFSAVDGVQSLRSCGLRTAPPPEQIVWNNLKLTPAERGSKQLIVNALYGILLLFWIVPSSFIGCFISNLSRLAAVWPSFGQAMNAHPTLFAILQGFLAPSITTLVFSVLPLLFRRLSHLQGKITRTEREQEVLRKLYAFFFLDNFFIFTLIGVIWDIVAQVLQQTHAAKKEGQPLTFREVWVTLGVAQRIATAIVNISSFWVMYILRGILGSFVTSAQPLSLLKRFSGWVSGSSYRETPRQRAENSMPEPFQYAVNFLYVLFYTTVALGFTTIQPLVLPTTFILFALSCSLKKYQICHMQVTKYESHGSFYPLVNDIVLFATAFGNLMLLCVVWVQAGWRIATACAPLPLTVVIFKVYTYFKFEKPFFLAGLEFYDEEAESVDDEEQLLSQSVVEKPFNISSKGDIGGYEDPQMRKSLDKPLLTFQQALMHTAGYTPSQLNTKKPANLDLAEKAHVEVSEHVYPSGYTPVEPYAVYQTPYRSFSDKSEDEEEDFNDMDYYNPYHNGAGLRKL